MKVRIKSGECPSYLTVGKVYETHSLFIDLVGFGGKIVDDVYRELEIRLDNGSWEVVDE